MQPLAIGVLVSGGLVVLGVVVTLIMTRRDTKPGRVTVNRWNRHGSLPLVGAGVVIGVISRGGGQSPVTHDVVLRGGGGPAPGRPAVRPGRRGRGQHGSFGSRRLALA